CHLAENRPTVASGAGGLACSDAAKLSSYSCIIPRSGESVKADRGCQQGGNTDVVCPSWFVLRVVRFDSLRTAHIPTGDPKGLGRGRPGRVGYSSCWSEPSSEAHECE